VRLGLPDTEIGERGLEMAAEQMRRMLDITDYAHFVLS
jgi:hypothetical protein